MEKILESWDKAHLEAFILFFAAHSDMIVTEDEKSRIVSHVGQEVFEEVLAQAGNLNDYQSIQLIQKLKDKHYPGEAGHNEIMGLLKEIINNDGSNDQTEKNLIMMMKRLV